VGQVRLDSGFRSLRTHRTLQMECSDWVVLCSVKVANMTNAHLPAYSNIYHVHYIHHNIQVLFILPII
jgi:hypothetical protein